MSDKKKVLVVEDEQPIRKLVVRVLNANNYNALGVENGQEGINTWRTYKPDAVLIDYRMHGDVDGFNVAEDLISGGYTGKRILISGNPGDMYLDHPEVEGNFDNYFDGFLHKPFRPQELLEKLEQVLKQ